jgi:hypothetical protein
LTHNSKDKIVSDLVDYFNEKTRLLNPTNVTIPRLAQDIIIASKPRTRKEVKYRKNFNLFHPMESPFRKMSVTHDMSKSEREINKQKVLEAKAMNEQDKSGKIKYIVKGPHGEGQL